jgi:S1-C subfamily serine protease
MFFMQSRNQVAQLATTLGGIPVWGCLPNSPAARLGIRYGDVILSVNGRPTPSADEYAVARDSRRDALVLVIFRDGQERTLELSLDARSTPLTREELEGTVQHVATARLVPTEHPPAPDANAV